MNSRCINAGLRCSGLNCADREGSDEVDCLESKGDVDLRPLIVGIVFDGVAIIGIILYCFWKLDDKEETRKYVPAAYL